MNSSKSLSSSSHFLAIDHHCTNNNSKCSSRSSSPSSPPVSISWHQLTVEVNQWASSSSSSNKLWCLKKEKKTILNAINGHFTAGSLNGLLGPSGAGKTTLLDVLSGRCPQLYSGSVQLWYGGTTTANDLHSSNVFYIHQHVHDCLVLELTVGQLLRYAFAFKNDLITSAKSTSSVEEHIEATLSALNLPTEVLNRPLKKCSGGEVKRVAIAQELMSLNPPAYLFLDEPTTGLDSVSAFEVISCLRRLAEQGNGLKSMTIIASIHSPNDETLHLFESLYVLAKGGVPVFEGPPNQIKATLERVLPRMTVPADQPPIEVLLKIACTGPSDRKVAKLARHCKRKEERETLKVKTETDNSENNSHISPPFTQTLQKGPKSFRFSNLLTHLCRQLRITFLAQLPSLFFGPLFLLLFFAALCTIFDREMTSASACYPLPPEVLTTSSDNRTTSSTPIPCDSETRLKEEGWFKENTLYFSYVYMTVFFVVALSNTLIFSRRLTSFEAEHRNRWYSLSVFTLSTSLVSLLETLFTAFFIASFSYLISGQHTVDFDPITKVSFFNWSRLSIYIGFFLLLALYAQSVGQLLGAVFLRWPTVAMISCELVATSASLFSGLYVKLEHMGSPAMIGLEDGLGLAGLSRGLIYSVYGHQRCDWRREYSWVLLEYSVDRARVGEYVWRAAGNILLLKLLTIVVLWWRFREVKRKKTKQLTADEAPVSSQKAIENEADNIQNSFSKVSELVIEDTCFSKMKAHHNHNHHHHHHYHRKSLNPSTVSSSDTVSLHSVHSLKEEQREYRLSCSKAKIQLAWSNLSLLAGGFSLLDNSSQHSHSLEDQKPILRHLFGAIRFNSLTALMGTSGSGKTTLLRVLNGQCKTKLAPDSEFHLSRLTSIKTCFISQEVGGHLLRGLTALQTLRYASMLRNYSTAAYSDLDLGNFEMEEEEEEVFDHQAIAHRWLEELGLADAAHTKVEHLSGGEAKRLVVAAELTADEMPNLVCCDEPLSGLDSHSAETVVRALRRLTDVHPLLTIVTSIHQPSAEVLALYDQLYVLARGGVCIFSGLPAQIQSTLEQASSANKSSATSFSPFPIENLIRQSCLDPEEPTNQALVELTRSHFSTTSFQAELSEQTALVADGVQHNRARFTAHSVVVLARRQLSYITSHLWKEWLFFALCSTAFGASLRLLYSADRIATVSGCLNLEDDLSQCRAKNATDLEKEFALKDNLIYGNFFCAFYLMLVLLAGARSFLHDYELFSNEHRNGAYSTGSWYLIKSTVEMVPLLPCIALFVAIVDIYEEAVPDQVRPLYPHVVILLVLGVLATTAQGHLVSLLAGGSLTGQTVLVIAVFLLGQLLQNYVIPIGQMHYLWQVGATFSVSRYLLESLMVLQYGFGRCLPRVEVQAVLYAMDIDIEGESDSRNFYAFNLAMLALNCLLFRLLALWVLVKRANPIDDRKGRVERLEEYRKKLKEVLTEQK